MGAIYEEHKDEDGFLYIAYSGENTFGGLQLLWSIATSTHQTTRVSRMSVLIMKKFFV